MYELVDEEELIFRFLFTMDGGESLRRVLGKTANSGEVNEDGEPVQGKSKERADNRDASDGYFIAREKVDKWVKEKVGEMLPTDNIEVRLTSLITNANS
jgi:uncharacterized protein YrzB (UPF0473 family)